MEITLHKFMIHIETKYFFSLKSTNMPLLLPLHMQYCSIVKLQLFIIYVK